jgi:hypothetical protein
VKASDDASNSTDFSTSDYFEGLLIERAKSKTNLVRYGNGEWKPSCLASNFSSVVGKFLNA